MLCQFMVFGVLTKRTNPSRMSVLLLAGESSHNCHLGFVCPPFLHMHHNLLLKMMITLEVGTEENVPKTTNSLIAHVALPVMLLINIMGVKCCLPSMMFVCEGHCHLRRQKEAKTCVPLELLTAFVTKYFSIRDLQYL